MCVCVSVCVCVCLSACFPHVLHHRHQDDVVMGTLTVRENLNFSASLRLSRALSKKERGQRVEGVIRDLGLTEVADSKVGTEFIRGISGGERKRTNIGMELITSPQILFLDEPTTGLDSSTARTVIQLLHRLGYMEVNLFPTPPHTSVFCRP